MGRCWLKAPNILIKPLSWASIKLSVSHDSVGCYLKIVTHWYFLYLYAICMQHKVWRVVYFLVSLDGVHLTFTFTTWWIYVSCAFFIYCILTANCVVLFTVKWEILMCCRRRRLGKVEVGGGGLVFSNLLSFVYHWKLFCATNLLPMWQKFKISGLNVRRCFYSFFLCYNTWHDSWYSVSYIPTNIHPSSIMLMTRSETLLTYHDMEHLVIGWFPNPWSDLWVMFGIAISNPSSLGIYMSGILCNNYHDYDFQSKSKTRTDGINVLV